MEDTIGYEALFSTEEWDSLELGEWDGLEELTEHPDAQQTTALYEVSEGIEIECELCGTVGTTPSEAQARVIALLHEQVGGTACR